MNKTVLIVGAFDTKGPEHAYLRDRIVEQGCNVMTLDIGVMADPVEINADIQASQVARAAGEELRSLRSANDRGAAMAVMSKGAAILVRQLYDESKFAGIVGMGGSGGSSVITAAMRSLPLGVPKVCVSTVAGGDTSAYVGTKDITMIPAVTDVAGINRISKTVFSQAAGAICGMVRVASPDSKDDRPIIVASMFGNTTACLDQCRDALDAKGYEVLVFHAIGSGGKTMESLIEEGVAVACLDLTTTEWADELCGGIFSAGTDRLSAAGRAGIPHIIAPGCVDMVNFGAMDSVPKRYRDANRLFYEWNPNVTLMRTNVEENRRLGEIFAEKANAAKGPVAILLPMRGVSILDGDGERFCDREADQAMFQTMRLLLRDDIDVIEIDANINDSTFSDAAVETTLNLIATQSRVNK